MSQPVKKSFNVILSTTDTSSFNGNTPEANFYVGFGNIISKQDMDRPYKVSVRFKSKWTTVYGVGDYLFFLSINFLNQTRVQQNTGFSQIFAILSRSQEQNTVQTTNNAPITYQFECGMTDNPPVYLDNLRDIAQLNVKILLDDMKSTVNNAFPNYAIILHFEEA